MFVVDMLHLMHIIKIENPTLVDSTNPYSELELYSNLSVLMLLLTLLYVIA
jgi:hypothetical protein